MLSLTAIDYRFMLSHYLKCALWSSNDEDGVSLDSEQYKTYELDDYIRLSSVKDILKFMSKAQNYLNDKATLDQVGHDFWLTRNGHGTGFWDRPEVYGEEQAAKLTELAKTFIEVNLYPENGKIYMM